MRYINKRPCYGIRLFNEKVIYLKKHTLISVDETEEYNEDYLIGTSEISSNYHAMFKVKKSDFVRLNQLSISEYKKAFFNSDYYMSKEIYFKFLISIFVIQLKFNVNQDFSWTDIRLNPWNPLTYFVLILSLYVDLINNIVKYILKFFEHNPFKYG